MLNILRFFFLMKKHNFNREQTKEYKRAIQKKGKLKPKGAKKQPKWKKEKWKETGKANYEKGLQFKRMRDKG